MKNRNVMGSFFWKNNLLVCTLGTKRLSIGRFVPQQDLFYPLGRSFCVYVVRPIFESMPNISDEEILKFRSSNTDACVVMNTQLHSKFKIFYLRFYFPFVHMAIFDRVVRNLVDFNLVTKLTKHVSKVRETVRKCKKNTSKWLQNVFLTLDSQKMTSRFLDSYFCTKFQISQPGWYPDQAIKNSPYGIFIGWFGVCLISALLQNAENVHQKCKNMFRFARNYATMTHRPELCRGMFKNSSRVLGFQFLGANSRFHNQADVLTRQENLSIWRHNEALHVVSV